MKSTLPLLALAMGSFAIGLTEFSPMGILPLMADGVGVSIPAAGLLITAYALGVTLGAPLVTLASNRFPRRGLLIGLITVYILGNLLAALATGYGMLMIARLIASLCQGTYFGVGAVVAGSLMPPGRQAGAVAAMFMGLTIANVLGVPAATWLGETLSWRATFWSMVVAGLVSIVALRSTLPAIAPSKTGNALAELSVLKRGPVLAAMGLTALISSAQFTVLTYISPILRTENGASAQFITVMLTTYGVGMCAGNWIGGKFSDRSVEGTLIVSLASLSCVLVLLAFALPYSIPAAILIFLCGCTSFAMIPALQVKVMSAAADAPNLASSVNIGAFNLGNAAGAAVGGGVIAAGWGYVAVVLAGAAIAALSLMMILCVKWCMHKNLRSTPSTEM